MNLFNELKRRNVFKVAAAYLIVSWLILQIIGSIVPIIEAPDWISKAILMLLLAGFPIALLFAWAFELTPEGIKKESDIVRDESITTQTSSKINGVIIAALVLIIGGFAYDKFFVSSTTTEIAQNEIKPFENTVKKDLLSETLESNPINDKSIAVLPFANMARTKENEPLTLGLHDDLLTHLSKISALKVISRTSVLRYQDTKKAISEIANELGVANILEGGIQRSGNQIRVNVQLIDAKTDKHLWAEIFDREITAANIFKIQTEISQKIATALKAQISPAEQKSIAHQATNNLDAYNAYLAGRQRILSRNSADLKQALTLFEKATDLDPNYALAYVAQANTLRLLNEYSDLKRSEMFKRGEGLLTKALSLQPNLAEAHTSKAAYLQVRGKLQQAEQSYLYSLSLNPNYATTYQWYGRLLRNDLDRYQEALKLHRKAAELDPLSPVIQVNVAWSLLLSGQSEDAEAQFYRVLELAPGFTQAPWGLSEINRDKGQVDEAIIWMRKAINSDPGNINSRIILVRLYLIINDLQTAKSEFFDAKKITPQHDSYLFVESYLDQFEGNYEIAMERIQKEQENKPNDLQIKKLIGYLYMLQGQNDKATQTWLPLYPNNDKVGFELNGNDLDEAVDLVWSLKQIGQMQKADNLITAIYALMKTMPENKIIKPNFLLLAIQGKPEAAAKGYAQLLKGGSISNWFVFDQLPYLASMRQEPEYLKAHHQLMENNKIQREHLAQIDLLEQQ